MHHVVRRRGLQPVLSEPKVNGTRSVLVQAFDWSEYLFEPARYQHIDPIRNFLVSMSGGGKESEIVLLEGKLNMLKAKVVLLLSWKHRHADLTMNGVQLFGRQERLFVYTAELIVQNEFNLERSMERLVNLWLVRSYLQQPPILFTWRETSRRVRHAL